MADYPCSPGLLRADVGDSPRVSTERHSHYPPREAALAATCCSTEKRRLSASKHPSCRRSLLACPGTQLTGDELAPAGSTGDCCYCSLNPASQTTPHHLPHSEVAATVNTPKGHRVSPR